MIFTHSRYNFIVYLILCQKKLILFFLITDWKILDSGWWTYTRDSELARRQVFQHRILFATEICIYIYLCCICNSICLHIFVLLNVLLLSRTFLRTILYMISPYNDSDRTQFTYNRIVVCIVEFYWGCTLPNDKFILLFNWGRPSFSDSVALR